MTSELAQKTAKVPRDEDGDQQETDGCTNDERATKAKRHDIEVPVAEVDIKLAEKLDNILKVSDTRKPRFFMNKPKATSTNKVNCSTELADINTGDSNDDKIRLKHKDFTKEQLRQRLSEKYETLVPELDSKRPTVKLVKILSATESLELGKKEAKKQLEHQLELNSVRGNQQARRDGIGSFRFHDGYELPPKCFTSGKKHFSPKHKSVSFAPNGRVNGVMATVKYFKPDENEATSSDDDDDDDDLDDDLDDEDDDDDENNIDDNDDATNKSCHLLTETGKEQTD